MHRIVKFACEWILPHGVYKLLRYSSKNSSNELSQEAKQTLPDEMLNHNSVFRNCHEGERCFILATGPSIKQQDLKLLKNEFCIAVSNFFVHPDFDIIRPKYYCVPGYHTPITEDAFQDWLVDLAKNASSDTIHFYALQDIERVESTGAFRDRNVNYLEMKASLESFLKDELDLAKPILSPQSVTIMALVIAIYMGFKSIYLLGCDHDWILHIGASKHFYSEHEHSLVRAGYDEWYANDIEYYCRSYIHLWQQYKALRRIADAKGISIWNATEGGMLDVFPRIHYESLLSL